MAVNRKPFLSKQMPHIVDLVMGIIGEPPPGHGRLNGAEKFVGQHGDLDQHESSEDLQKKIEGHNVVPKMQDELDKRGATGIVEMANSKLHLQGPITSPSRYLASTKSIRYDSSCPACRKLKKFVKLQRMSLKPPCEQKSEHKRGVVKRNLRHTKKYPCSSRRYGRRNKRANRKFRRQNSRRRGRRSQDGRNTAVSIASSNISDRSRQVSSREELPNDDDSEAEEPMVES